MSKIVLITLLLFVGVTVNGNPHKHKKKQEQGTHILSVAMSRTGCYGRCPEYTVEIDKDGKVTYTGKRFTPDIGTYTKTVGRANAMEVISQFDTYRVDTCSNLYRYRIADLPGIIFTIKYTDSTKNINNANFGPPFLKRLATIVDKAGNKTDDNGWVKTDVPSTK